MAELAAFFVPTGGGVAVTAGGTGATTAAQARANLGTAASGANTDITSLGGLTTPLAASEGGTGMAGVTSAVSTGANGYLKLYNGVIIQWGSITLGSGANTYTGTYSFPVAFPSACFVAVGTPASAANTKSGGIYTYVQSFTASTVTIHADSGDSTQPINNITYRYIAVGN